MRVNPANASPRWHALPADAVAGLLSSDARAGLTDAEAAQRLLAHGPNRLAEAPPRPAWKATSSATAMAVWARSWRSSMAFPGDDWG